MRFEELLERLARTLEAESIPYMVIGGQAVLAHGEFRVTKDIDITLGVDSPCCERIASAPILESNGSGSNATDDYLLSTALNRAFHSQQPDRSSTRANAS